MGILSIRKLGFEIHTHTHIYTADDQPYLKNQIVMYLWFMVKLIIGFFCFTGSTALDLLESFVALYRWRIFKKVKETIKIPFLIYKQYKDVWFLPSRLIDTDLKVKVLRNLKWWLLWYPPGDSVSLRSDKVFMASQEKILFLSQSNMLCLNVN